MRVTREYVASQAAPTAAKARTIPALSPTGRLSLAITGACLAIAGVDIGAVWVTAIGVILTAAGAYAIGTLDGRRSGANDPRIAEVARERDHWRSIAAWAGARLEGPAPDDRGPVDAPAPAAARPSASVRGGGRPGSTGALPDPSTGLDAPLPGETGGVTA